ncbi:methyltransferase [Cerasicoccus frondis]|uniref:methyltransferase n=1 Tax=Cerasicoccus frondis TaxID=490090 RepID=UPI0028527499|nr:methyltransferase [Cerasicoccus frondis]
MATSNRDLDKLWDLLLAPVATQAIGAMARLGVADCLADGPKTTAAIASAVNAHESSLRRCLRMLTGYGLFERAGEDAWALTEMGAALKSDSPMPFRYRAMVHTDPVNYGILQRMTECIQTGEPQAEAALGSSAWDFYQSHPEHGGNFGQAMANFSEESIQAVVENCDFSAAGTIVDVGGAYGALLAAVLRKAPEAKGVLFDLPNSVENADETLGDVSPRVERVGGSFLEDPLPAGDLFLLKHVLHNWDDARCVTILKGIRAAMNPGAKLLVVEVALPEGDAYGPALPMDLLMMVVLGGVERTLAEYEALFAQAGLKLAQNIPNDSVFALIEAVAV